MAIGTIAAIALGVGALGSAAISSSASGRASNAATQAADQAAAVQREQLHAAQSALAPWQQSGLAANNQINALLGLGGTSAPATQQPYGGGYNPLTGAAQPSAISRAFNPNSYAQWQVANDPVGTQPGTMPGTTGQTAQQAAQGAFDNYRNSTGYQFRLNQGLDAVNSGYAGSGTLKSGAALRSINDYGQGMASQEFGNYLAALGNQQQYGAGAATALAGVSTNTGNSLAQIYQNRGDAIGNAELANGRNMNSLIGGLTSGIMRYGVTP